MKSVYSLITLVVLAGLGGCSNIGYRCPLDPKEKPESPTACAGMREAMAGAKAQSGGKTSVLVDDKGRLIPPELVENKAAKPLSALLGTSTEPYRNASGQPVYEPPRVFQAWAGAFVDAEGNLHDGHHAWFTTPGRWAYGTVNANTPVGSSVLRPAHPDEMPEGRIISTDSKGAKVTVRQTAPANTGPLEVKQPITAKESNQAAMQNLSATAKSVAAKQQAQRSAAALGGVNPQSANGVTSPSVSLMNDD